MKISIVFDVETDNLCAYNDEYLAQLWHVSQANPAPFGDASACEFAELLSREIVSRWLKAGPIGLWSHQRSHQLAAGRSTAAASMHKQAFTEANSSVRA